MLLTTIGTGTVAPHPLRVCSGQLVAAGDVRLLLDCGGGVVHRMAALGIHWQSISHVALTHFHPDHWSDLAPLLMAWRYGALPAREAPLVLVGPVGLRERLAALAAALGDWVLAPGYPLEVCELPAGERVHLSDGVALESRAVPHTPESVAYSVEQGGRRLVYTGDTGYDAGLAAWAAGSDLLLAECSLPDSMAIPTHLTPGECGALAEIARPRHLVLTHFYPPVEREDIPAFVAARFDGRVTLAVDGWTTEL